MLTVQSCHIPSPPPTHMRMAGPRPHPSLPPLPSGPHTQTACLDGARAIALLIVLAFHTVFITCMRGSKVLSALAGQVDTTGANNWPLQAQWLSSVATQPMAAGDIGVDVFFVLSG